MPPDHPAKTREVSAGSIENPEALHFRRVYPDDMPIEGQEANIIDPGAIEAAIKAGCNVEVVNAVIGGALVLDAVEASGKITIRNTLFKGRVDWSQSTFRHVIDLEGSTFEKEASFNSADFNRKLILNGAQFKAPAYFRATCIADKVRLSGAIFEDDANFTRIQIGADAFFEYSRFKRIAKFTYAHITGAATFTGSEFDHSVDFNGSRVDGPAFFEHACFKGEADFIHIRIGGTAQFGSAVFEKLADFRGLRVQLSAFFEPVVFQGGAEFINSRIGGDFYFQSSEFKDRADFSGSIIESNAFFNATTFSDNAHFLSMQVKGTAEFNLSEFKGDANFNGVQIGESLQFKQAFVAGKADFIHLCVGRNAEFYESQFKSKLFFISTRIEDNVTLWETEIHDETSFQNASVGAFFFSPTDSETPCMIFEGSARVDLRGCTYRHIHPITFWQSLMERLEPHDRQPYTQLENTFRQAGRDVLANDVFYRWKRQQSKQLPITNPAWLPDRFLWLITGYGVRLRRLFLAIAILLAAATLVFQIEGAVEPSNGNKPDHAVGYHIIADSSYALTYPEAFWFSLNRFLPVNIPSGESWKPSTRYLLKIPGSVSGWGITFTTVATLIQLAGWVLIPVGLASISGILKR